MPNYYFNSSHNTYAEKGQLWGDSEVDMYNYAINEGFKIVELDIHDDKPEPKITHGMTLVSNIKLRDVLVILKKNAFRLSSTPMLLSLELGLPKEKHGQVKDIILEVLGEENILAVNERKVPKEHITPKNGAYKFILMQEARRVFNNQIDPENAAARSSGLDHMAAMAGANVGAEIKPILGMIGVHYIRNKPDKMFYQSWEFTNQEESKLVEFMQDPEFVETLARQLKKFNLRLYPKGFRFTSSNLDPISFWQMGVQMAVLNIQTLDDNVLINKFLFQRNNACGYVLKPARLRGKEDLKAAEIFAEKKSFTLKVTPISGFMLQNAFGNKRISKCYAKFYIRGNKSDNENKAFETEELRFGGEKSNSLNSIFDTTGSHEFDIYEPDLSFVIVNLYGDGDLVCRSAIQMEHLKEGMRSVTFVDKEFRKQRNVSLLVKFEKIAV